MFKRQQYLQGQFEPTEPAVPSPWVRIVTEIAAGVVIGIGIIMAFF